MTRFHAVMVDETGCEFGADVTADTHEEAYDRLRESYPESRVAQLESPEDTLAREREIYARVCAEMDGDCDYDYDEWDDEEDEE